jgi:hypothetical protein
MEEECEMLLGEMREMAKHQSKAFQVDEQLMQQ